MFNINIGGGGNNRRHHHGHHHGRRHHNQGNGLAAGLVAGAVIGAAGAMAAQQANGHNKRQIRNMQAQQVRQKGPMQPVVVVQQPQPVMVVQQPQPMMVQQPQPMMVQQPQPMMMMGQPQQQPMMTGSRLWGKFASGGVMYWQTFCPLMANLGVDANTALSLWNQSDQDRSGSLNQQEWLSFCNRADTIAYIRQLEVAHFGY